MTSADISALLKKHPIGVGCALLALACGVMLYLRSGDIGARQTELDARSAEAAKMTANIRNSSNLAEQVAEIQAQTKEVEARLMKASQLAVNYQYFFKLETETEIKLIDARQNTLPKGAKTNYQGIPFTVSLQGTFSQVMNFLNKLQTGRHFCRINTANFSKSNDAGAGAPLINLSINLELLGQP